MGDSEYGIIFAKTSLNNGYFVYMEWRIKMNKQYIVNKVNEYLYQSKNHLRLELMRNFAKYAEIGGPNVF